LPDAGGEPIYLRMREKCVAIASDMTRTAPPGRAEICWLHGPIRIARLHSIRLIATLAYTAAHRRNGIGT